VHGTNTITQLQLIINTKYETCRHSAHAPDVCRGGATPDITWLIWYKRAD